MATAKASGLRRGINQACQVRLLPSSALLVMRMIVRALIGGIQCK
jgi:hypothetical protein